MISFLIGLFLFALDNTIVADVQPAIVDRFQSVDKISWLATGFFMAAAGTTVSLISSNCSFRSSFRPIRHDLSSEVVLYLQRLTI
jgi:hypothetical protein